MALPALMAALGLALKVGGKVGEGNAAAATGRINDRIAKRNAIGIERDAAMAEERSRAEVRRTLGTQLAAQGESGFQMGTGSALDALMESQVEGMLEQLTIRRRGAAQAVATRFGGTMARREGNQRAKAAYLSAASDLIGSQANYASYGTGGGGG